MPKQRIHIPSIPPTAHTHTASEVGAATSTHNHDADYASINHSHSNYATNTALDELATTVSGKANSSHTHNDIYYTETEIDAMLADKSDIAHTHTGVYDIYGASASALSSANSYTDTEISALSETVSTKANASALTSHTGNANIHFTKAERDKLGNIAENANNYTLPSAGTSLGGVKSGGDVTIASGIITVNDDSHNHTIANIDGLQTALDGKSANTHNHDGSYYTETEVDEILETKANVSHTHTIANITNLQSALDGKAAASHGTHVTYSTTAPVMDGAASVGTASTVARSDHRHPTDTSRASKTEFDTHTSDATVHITSTERTNWGTAYTHSQAVHAPSDAQKNQNAFSNIKVGTTTVAADAPTDTLTLVAGTNVTITPDATGDSITIASKNDNTTYSAGTGISLSGTTFNNAGVRSIATGSANGTISVNTNGTSANVAVKGLGSAAYTASTAYDAAGTAQTKADSALASAKSYTDTKVANLVNGAPTTLDTLKEIADAMAENDDVVSALNTAVGTKANASDLTSHTSNKSNPHNVTLSQLGLTATAAEINKMDGVTATTAELNILDGVTATTTELNYVDGVTSNIQTQLDGKAASSHNHSASNITSGTLSSDRLPTVPISKGGTGATTAASALTNLGVTATAAELNKLDGVTATTAELNYVDGVTSNIQTQLNGKASSGHTHSNMVTAGDNRSVATTPNTYSNKLIFQGLKSNSTIGSPSDDTYSYVVGLRGWSDSSGGNSHELAFNNTGIYTRNGATTSWGGWNKIYTSANKPTPSEIGAAASSHTHNYAGSSSAGGAATSANKLNTNAGSATQPVYFANGVPVATTYTLGKSVPSNAVFTDTNTKVTNTLATTTKAYVTGTTSATTNTGTQVFDTGVYLDTTAGKLTATTFGGATFTGSGVATVSEVETYLGI